MLSEEVISNWSPESCPSRAKVKVGRCSVSRAHLSHAVAEVASCLKMLISDVLSILNVYCVLLLLYQLPLGILAILLRSCLRIQVELIPGESLHLKTIEVLHLLLVHS